MKEISNMGFTPELCFEHLRYHFAQEVKKREKSFVAEPSQMESMKKVASWLTTGKEHCWLVLNGITGNGKTTCVKGMRSFINCCKIPDPSNGEGSVFSSKAGIWLVTARELYQMFVSNKPKFERCANTYILAIDGARNGRNGLLRVREQIQAHRAAVVVSLRQDAPDHHHHQLADGRHTPEIW